jgi:hypothetical protein
MFKFFVIIKAVLELLPMVIVAMKGLEDIFPENGSGALRLAVIRTTIEKLYTLGKNATVQFEELWPALETVIEGIVVVFNKNGVFKKSTTTTV